MEWTFEPEPETRGRKPLAGLPASANARMAKTRAFRKAQRIENIAILDMETDPFDPVTRAMVCPFLAVLYSDNFEPIVIWEEDKNAFAEKVYTAIYALPGQYTVYAHNGGKFDYMFLIHLLRGTVRFKGRALMCARIGRHELRDSLHIIPEKLAAWKKDTFDYLKMQRGSRDQYREEIIRYCINDCRYLLEIVSEFVKRYGFKLSIGQAAMAALKQHYKVKTIGENLDGKLRQFFFGGRVECIRGRGYWSGEYNLYDVNSMYPFVMASYRHPVSNEYTFRTGTPGPNTVFMVVECLNRGALVKRDGYGETSANEQSGQFFTTIHEYNVARQYGLISNVRIIQCVDCAELSTFEKFVTPLYENRQKVKALLKSLPEGTPEYENAKKDDFFFKYLLNNAYGKFAQNPRRYKESYITGVGEKPTENEPESWGTRPIYECNSYWIWERPQEKLRFNNVGTAASITGAARSVLLSAIHSAVEPIYCDTDSLICRSISQVEIHPTKLGAWDLEKTYSDVVVAGKKLYACKVLGLEESNPKKFVLKSKGTTGLKWQDYLDLLKGEEIGTLNKAPTMTKAGRQFYMQRKVRATAPALEFST